MTAPPVEVPKRLAVPTFRRAKMLEVLRLIAQGRTNAQIAHEIGRAEGTVADRVRALLAWLDATDRAHAVAIAYQQGFLEISAHVRKEVRDRHAAGCALLAPRLCDCREVSP